MLSWKDPKYNVVTTQEQITDLCSKLEKAIKNDKIISIDVETTGVFSKSALNPYHGWLLGIVLAFNKLEGYYIPLNHTKNNERIKSQLTTNEFTEIFNPILSSGGVYLGHNLKFDYKFLWNAGIHLNPRLWDTYIAALLLDDTGKINQKGTFSLKTLAPKLIYIPNVETFEEASGGNAAEQDIDKFCIYAIRDVIFTLYLYEEYKPKIDKNFYKLFYECEMSILPILAHMELRGLTIDAEYYKNLRKPVEKYIDFIDKYFHKQFDINIGSSEQLAKVIENRFQDIYKKLIYIKKYSKKTGRISTDVQSLELIMKDYPKRSIQHKIAKRALKYRGLNKIINTYVKKYPNVSEQYIEEDGIRHVLHTSYRQIVNSGRLSSSPNIQNIPRDSIIDVKRGFIPRKGHKFVIADWAGQELRIVAVASKEPVMVNAFLKDPVNADLHTLTASILFGIREDKITPEQRFTGKTINFSIIYGATEHSISKTLQCSKEEALELLDNYFDTYKKLKEWKQEQTIKIQNQKYTETFFGRRRYLRDVEESWQHNSEIRALINHIIQGTGADLLKFALVKITKEFAKLNLNAYPICTTHDEITVETTEPEKVKEIMKDSMEVHINKIFFPVDINVRTSFSKKDIVHAI